VLAELPEQAVNQLLARVGRRTTVDPVAFHRELAAIRSNGYAEDDGEQEVGVRCIAVTVPGGPAGAAISISGPEARMSMIAVDDVVPLMHRVAGNLARELSVGPST
jgi:IclR family acetate operon transcriptional repressor